MNERLHLLVVSEIHRICAASKEGIEERAGHKPADRFLQCLGRSRDTEQRPCLSGVARPWFPNPEAGLPLVVVLYVKFKHLFGHTSSRTADAFLMLSNLVKIQEQTYHGYDEEDLSVCKRAIPQFQAPSRLGT